MSFDFVIRDWAAWAPGLSGPDDWRQWVSGAKALGDELPPAPATVPKALQRRLGPLARAVLHTVGQCISPNQALPAIFSSAHGEIGKCLQMLETLQANEELSPTAFSLSVHNAIGGLFSMAYGNRMEITALAPAAGGIGPGFIEALGMLNEGHPEVLVVFYDEILPEFFPTAPFAMSASFPCALALRLAKQGAEAVLRFGLSSSVDQSGEQPLQLPAFIQFLLSGQTTLRLANQDRGWQWQKL